MAADSSRQIKQMVNFIMQEAHEKVNEIRIKVGNGFVMFFSLNLWLDWSWLQPWKAKFSSQWQVEGSGRICSEGKRFRNWAKSVCNQ